MGLNRAYNRQKKKTELIFAGVKTWAKYPLLVIPVTKRPKDSTKSIADNKIL